MTDPKLLPESIMKSIGIKEQPTAVVANSPLRPLNA